MEAVNFIAVGSQQSRFGDLYDAIFDAAIKDKDVRAMRLAAEVGLNMLNKQVIDSNVNVEDLQTKSSEEIEESHPSQLIAIIVIKNIMV